MQKGNTLLSVVCAVTALVMVAAMPQSAAPTITAWTNGQWFDGMSFIDADVYSVGPRLTMKRPGRISRTVDLGDAYVTPAFGEAHNHNLQGSEAAAAVRMYLAQGIYYVMIQTNMPEAREQLKGKINSDASINVAFSNGVFTAPGRSDLVERLIANGEMTAFDRDGGFLLPVTTTDDIDRQWRTRVAKQQPDFIKMALVYSEDLATGRVPPSNNGRGLDPELAPYLVGLAHKEKLRVSAHVQSAYDFDVAVKAGADIIAHLPGFWPDPERIARSGLGIYRISEESARRAGQQRITVITTLTESLRSRVNDQTTSGFGVPLLELYRENLTVLAKYGVGIAIGSDQNRGMSVQEALAIHRAGLMPPAQLLRALSSDTAATIFPQRAPFGLAEGAPADFLVLDGNPIADLNAITRIRLRVKGGDELHQTPMPGSEAALRELIEGLLTGQPRYDRMSPGLATARREQLPQLQSLVRPRGAVRSLSFKGVGPAGGDIYHVQFDNGVWEYRVAMGRDGKMTGGELNGIPLDSGNK